MTTFVNCSAGSTLQVGAGVRYRATWAAGGVARFLWRGGLVESNLIGIYNKRLADTGAAWPASSPYITPDGTAGSMDVKVAAAWSKRTVADLARLLAGLADTGINLELSRLELVRAGETSAAGAEARAGASAAADEAAKANNPLTKTASALKTAGYIAAGVGVLWVLWQAGVLRAVARKARSK